ncbi:hypothetical protein CPB84DRAFT_1731520 [Gymnopilus junonius]|uniref:Transmembrane protein n=1 Tax=Gymnopilus junonius TaxID=109634 RepID=A0A9P5TMU7_GYMJU|nr:hypothetical protein CPB84DRAFT_1731520 [Gymnopilus junonius]
MSGTPSTSYASTSNLDLEAQRPTPPLGALTPAVTHSTWTVQPLHVLDPMDEQFGYTLSSSRTHESRHDRRQSAADVLPPYAEEAEIPLPGYTLHAPEPMTLAMYLFRFGFLFPPFWLFGAFILCSPLREPRNTSEDTPTWMPEKTEEERQKIIATIREAELKWAKRCLWALVIFAVLVAVGVLAAWAVLRS